MAWSASDFSSVHRTDWDNTLAELCLALNEREAVVGLTETQFYVNTGATKARPSASEIAGIGLLDATAGVPKNMDLLQDGIETLYNSTGYQIWVTTGTEITNHWHDDIGGGVTRLIDDIGLGSWSAQPDPNNGDDWERIREALDRLVYIYIQDVPHTREVDVRSEGGDEFGYTENQEGAWDAARLQTPSAGNNFSGIEWEQLSGTTGNYSATLYGPVCTLTINTSAYDGYGTITKAVSIVGKSAKILLNPAIVDYGGTTISVSSGDTTLTTQEVEHSGVSLSTDYVIDFDFITSEPTDSPFEVFLYPDSGIFEVYLSRFNMVIDTSENYADQA